jgi:hypothetical protein
MVLTDFSSFGHGARDSPNVASNFHQGGRCRIGDRGFGFAKICKNDEYVKITFDFWFAPNSQSTSKKRSVVSSSLGILFFFCSGLLFEQDFLVRPLRNKRTLTSTPKSSSLILF